MNILPHDGESVIPLTPHEFYALLALAKAQDGGYGLMATIKADTGGLIAPAPGTIYPLLKRLARLRYITKLDPQPGSGPTGSNYAYRITDIGLMVLEWEAGRFAEGAKLANGRLKLANDCLKLANEHLEAVQ